MSQTAEQLFDRMRSAGRKVLPMHQYLAEHDLEVLEAYDAFLRKTIYEKDALDAKTKEMVLAVACLGAGSPLPVVAAHARKAMAAGADRQEVLQALELAAAVAATRTMAGSTLAMMEAEKD
ncbi:MAG: carboxymuconolactone decarboxylase family protein [bacterium]|nr:carboxymuconolactone decarboxylase family protein [Acidimicrobiia bacterium]MCY4651308.1 carboxymuconolactone decarboxylase family protein [bacterium]